MSEEKKISEKTYKWAHYGVIIYHTLTAFVLIASQYTQRIFSLSSRTVVIILASLLLIISLLAIIPIAKDYNKIVIE